MKTASFTQGEPQHMLAGVLVAVVVAATPIKLAVPSFTGANVSETNVSFYVDHLAQGLTREGIDVITSRQMGLVLGLERQRQLLGCADDAASCAVELGNALGVDAIVNGSVGRFGDAYQVNITVFSAKDARQLAETSQRVASEEKVLDALARSARVIAAQLRHKLRGEPLEVVNLSEPAGEQPSTGARRYAWIPAVGAGALFGTGAYFSLQAKASYDQLATWRTNGTTLDATAAARLRDDGKQEQTVGLVLLGGGVVSLGVAAAMFFSGGASDDEEDEAARLIFTGNGVGVAGAFP